MFDMALQCLSRCSGNILSKYGQKDKRLDFLPLKARPVAHFPKVGNWSSFQRKECPSLL